VTKKEKAAEIAKILDNLYPQTPIPLSHQDAYTLLVAVLLSAQCTDERVNKVTPHLFKLADNPFDMVKLTVPEIADIIRPCGLSPRKSKAIFDLSHIIINEHKGSVPASFEQLEALPGVGHKTASVVMSQAFGIPAFPIDTHIHRLAYRWGLSTGKNVYFHTRLFCFNNRFNRSFLSFSPPLPGMIVYHLSVTGHRECIRHNCHCIGIDLLNGRKGVLLKRLRRGYQ
jgi:endonuclease-3